MAVWNPWHGCKKISAGCDICYVYEKDAMYGKNASVIRRTANFDLPVKKNRRGEYKAAAAGGTGLCVHDVGFFPAGGG